MPTNQVNSVSGINSPISPIENNAQVGEVNKTAGGVAEKKPQSDLHNYSSIGSSQATVIPEDISPNNPFLSPPKISEAPLTEAQFSQARQVQDSQNVTVNAQLATQANLNNNMNGNDPYKNAVDPTSVKSFTSQWANFANFEINQILEGLDPKLAKSLSPVLQSIESQMNGMSESDPDSLQSAYQKTSKQAQGLAPSAEEEAALTDGLLKNGMTNASLNQLTGKGYSITEINNAATQKNSNEPRVVEQGVEEFRFAGNYLAVIAKVLSLLNILKTMMASIEGDMLKKQMEAEKGNMRAQMDVMMKKLKETFLERQQANRIKEMDSGAAKWVMFAIQIVVTIVMIAAAVALTVLTAGAMGPIALGIVIGVLVASTAVMAVTMSLQFLQMVGFDVMKELVLACGGKEDDVWIAKLVLAIVIFVVCVGLAVVGAGVASYQAGMGAANTITMMTMSGLMMAATVGPQVVSYSNVIFEVTYRLATALGMDEEAAAILAMVLTIISMILMMVASLVCAASAGGIMMKLNPSLAGLTLANQARTTSTAADDAMTSSQQLNTTFTSTGRIESAISNAANKLGLYKHYGGRSGAAIHEGAEVYDPKAGAPTSADAAAASAKMTPQQTVDANQAAALQRVKEQLENLRKIFEVKGWKDAAVESLVVVQEICMAIQAISSIVQGVSMIIRGKLILEQADLQYNMAVMQAMLDFLKAMNPTYDRAIDAILEDMQNGMMKMATELHKIFESAVNAASRSSTARSNAIKS